MASGRDEGGARGSSGRAGSPATTSTIGDEERRRHLVDRVLDEGRRVVGDVELHALAAAWRAARAAPRAPPRATSTRARLRLLDDAEADRRLAVVAGQRALVLGAELRPRRRRAAGRTGRRRFRATMMAPNSSGVARSPRVRTANSRSGALDAARRGSRRSRRGSARSMSGDGEPVRGQPLRVEPDAHRVAALAADEDRADARHALQPLLEDAVGDVGQLERR